MRDRYERKAKSGAVEGCGEVKCPFWDEDVNMSDAGDQRHICGGVSELIGKRGRGGVFIFQIGEDGEASRSGRDGFIFQVQQMRWRGGKRLIF